MRRDPRTQFFTTFAHSLSIEIAESFSRTQRYASNFNRDRKHVWPGRNTLPTRSSNMLYENP